MKIQINGKTEEITDGLTVKKLLDFKGINHNVVACELNQKILRRANLQETPLKDGDVLEIIQMIGGG